MTRKSGQWTRRQFNQALAVAAAWTLLDRRSLATTRPPLAGFAFVAAGGESPLDQRGSIQVFQVAGSRWNTVQALSVAAPAHLELHPHLPLLYAVHAVGLWNSLPRGAVSAYDIHPATGHLTLRVTQPLSLAAIYPRHAALSPDVRHLLVAAEDGGIYNLLPLAPDGSPGPPTAIRKEHGLGEAGDVKTARPRHVVFHPSGTTAFTADVGQESISTFTCERDSIRLEERTCSHAGAGPSQLIHSSSGSCVYALHAGDGSIAVHRLEGLQIAAASQILSSRRPDTARMALHPTGRFLITAGGGNLTTLAIDPRSGSLTAISSMSQQQHPAGIAFTPDGNHLISIQDDSGEISQAPFHAAAGIFDAPQIVARVEAACSVLFRSA
ncbi:MAG: hypothetical protein JWM43_2992 [Acidobacteriaceae bacterium]|nr:hypothetical protein [Acidobacteriaceae bacterium]